MADETTDPSDSDESDLAADREARESELDVAGPPPRDLSREAALVSAGLLVAAAVLCVVAPFRAVYTLRAGGLSASFDGWGRYDLAAASQHGPRYGVALTAAAIVLVVAAATRLRDLRPVDRSDYLDYPDATDRESPDGDVSTTPARSDDRLAVGIGVAGSALLLGVLAAVALNIQSTLDNAGSIASSGGESTSVDVGAMLWLLVGAWVVSVVGLWIPWYESRRRAWAADEAPAPALP
ncbi:hypothetical protein [uncultured Jatrophihabitans sp.]|uniref:hypothetical protein n=1 Tax=uncultured Jatrophihabitans sp. TaxID=1610747 RepID=UPI0035C9D44D